MKGSSQQILIRWPQKALFNYICDIENYPEWQHAVYSTEWLTSQRHEPGAKFVETRIHNARKEEYFGEVRENIPLQKRTLLFRKGRVHSTYTYQFEATDQGTLVSICIQVKAPELLGWTEYFLAERLRNERVEELLKLKEVLERENDDVVPFENIADELQKK